MAVSRTRRVPLLAVGLLAMAYGGWLGLARIGWNVPLLSQEQLIVHGPLMVCGFLGTLIALERAVGLARPWAYAAPICTGAGAVLLVTGAPPAVSPPLLITAGSFVVLLIFLAVLRRQPSLFSTSMALGAAAWTVGNARWAAGVSVFRIVFWWIAFVVLTIAGERLELNRVLRPSRMARLLFVAAATVLLAGVAIDVAAPEAGVRIAGAGLLATTWWLAQYDIARRTVRMRGVTRFMAICLLSGYVWLGIAGALALATGVADTGLMYDATLHAVFLGFAISMVFGHAPVIFPAVLGRPLDYRPTFYVHLAVLHVSVALRVIGDLVDTLGRLRPWGGLLNFVALLLFVAATAHALARGSAPVPRSAQRI